MARKKRQPDPLSADSGTENYAKDTPISAFWENVNAKLGRTNRTCPKCGLQSFLVAESKEQEDGSTLRERRCKRCGHIEKRIAPPEKPA